MSTLTAKTQWIVVALNAMDGFASCTHALAISELHSPGAMSMRSHQASYAIAWIAARFLVAPTWLVWIDAVMAAVGKECPPAVDFAKKLVVGGTQASSTNQWKAIALSIEVKTGGVL